MARDDIETFVRERDAVLLRADLDEVVAFQRKHNPHINWDSFSHEESEVGMHKAITAVPSLPRQHRMKSKHWLAQRGYRSFDDGDLSDA